MTENEGYKTRAELIAKDLAKQEEQYLREVFNLKPDEHPKTLQDLAKHKFKCAICGKTKKATQAILDVSPLLTKCEVKEKNAEYRISALLRVICKKCLKKPQQNISENKQEPLNFQPTINKTGENHT